jgi:hypothetical protein
MQRFMFPMRGFHQDFSIVTPPVTWQVERGGMFRGCVAMSGISARLHGLAGRSGCSGGGVTLP